MGSRPKMRRSDTERNTLVASSITSMADRKTLWYRTNEEFVKGTMDSLGVSKGCNPTRSEGDSRHGAIPVNTLEKLDYQSRLVVELCT